MAHLRDRSGHIIGTTTTEGEAKSRELRRLREEEKIELREYNQQMRRRRSPEQQLAVLDSRLGKGIGAEHERMKLKQQIEERKSAQKRIEEEKAKKEQDMKNRDNRKPKGDKKQQEPPVTKGDGKQSKKERDRQAKKGK